MAREMTPQERAAQLYGSLTCTTYRDGYQDPDNDIALIADVLQQTRRAALRDVLSDLDSLHWKEHWYADQLRKKINDRLVSEGGLGC